MDLLREIFPSVRYRVEDKKYEIGGSILLSPSEAAIIIGSSLSEQRIGGLSSAAQKARTMKAG